MSVYSQKTGQSIGDVNVFSNGKLNHQMTEQIRNGPTFEKMVEFVMKYPAKVRIPFSKTDAKIKSFKELN